MRALVNSRPPHCPWICVGDANVDMLPEFEDDPWQWRQDRADRHAFERSLFKQWLDEDKAFLIDASEVQGRPMSSYADVAAHR